MATDVVQAKCPGCQQTLRIPAAWVTQSFRCKYCGLVIQGRKSAAPAEPAPTPLPPTQPPAPAEAVPPLDDGPIIRPPSGYRRRSHGLGWTLMMLTVVFVLPLAAIGSLAALVYFHAPDVGPETPDQNTANTPRADGETGERPRGEPVTAAASKDVFPRRALIVSVNNYLYANPITHGFLDSEVGGAARARNVSNLVSNLARALHIPDNQITELSDSAARNPHAPLKPVIERTVGTFLDSSRPQDCILLFFVGHAVEIGDEPYLVPIEGELGVKETLIPLKWLYGRLEKCKARQKVLVLDVCRYDPARGLERPDGGEMGEKLDALLQKPPAGVEVWSACVARQRSYELSEAYQSDGMFLDELFVATDPDSPNSPARVNLGLQRPQDPIPVEKLADAVDRRTEREVRTEHKTRQTPRLVGRDPTDGAVYDPKEAPPKPVEIEPPPTPAGGIAGRALVQGILRETDVIPPVKVTASPLQYDTLPPFSASNLEDYRADYRSLKDLEAEADKYPLRKAVLDTIRLLKKHEKSFREAYPGGTANAQEKAKILQEQGEPAKINAELQEQLEELVAAGKQRDKETSKRWQANYDYVMARLTARIAFVYEYNLMLGKIRKDDMPELDPKIHNGWRLASQEKLHLKEAKEMTALSQAALDKLIKENPGTPWEVLAKRDRLTALGLEWQPARYSNSGP